MREPDEIIHEKQLTLFSEAFLNDPAKICQSQESKPDLKENEADYGLRCCESSASSDPIMLLLKTCVGQSISPSIPCTPVWSEKATKSTLTLFQHLRLVRPTKGKDCSLSGSEKMSMGNTKSLWRTPDANCDRGPSSAERMAWKEENKMPISLNDQVAHCGQVQLQVTEDAEQ